MISIFGVSSQERLPRTRAFWIGEGKEYACWKIQIFWKDYTGWIDAMWREEYDHYEVVTVWGSFADLMEDENIATALIKGMELLRIIHGQMLKVGRPPDSGKFKSNEDFLTAPYVVLQEFPPQPSEPVALQRLSKHRLWRGNILTLEEAT